MPGLFSKLLVIGHVWPEPSATAAGKRMVQLLDCFKEFGLDITFVSAAAKTEYSLDLSKLDIAEVPIVLNDPGFDNFIRELSPDIVVFDRFMTEEQYGWRVAENLPSCLRILNTEDLHSLRTLRGQKHKENEPFHLADWLQSGMAKRELASLYRSDQSLIISQYEMELLNEKADIPSELLFYLPFIYTEKDRPAEEVNPSFDNRSDFIFVGNGKHQPNVDAVNWLHKEIWPLIRSLLPDTRLHVYGGYYPEKIQKLHHPESGFLIHGWTQNSEREVSNSRVNLVPLRFGAGIKGKLVEAMFCETPSISTSIGWEGIPINKYKDVIGIDNALEFAKRTASLYSDHSDWISQQKIQKRIFLDTFKKTDYLNALQDKFRDLATHLEAHRLKNIVGSLLLHHSTASTKYLSKWIEAKNKLENMK